LNPEELQDAKGIEIQNSFMNHSDPTKVVLDAGGRKISQNQLKKIIELNKLKELSIENADIQEISLSQAVKLETLTIKNCMHLERLDVKGAKKLTVENAPVKKLNLEKINNLKKYRFSRVFLVFYLILPSRRQVRFLFFPGVITNVRFSFQRKIG
jgi:Leucine-rich repeat (LRR) protein